MILCTILPYRSTIQRDPFSMRLAGMYVGIIRHALMDLEWAGMYVGNVFARPNSGSLGYSTPTYVGIHFTAGNREVCIYIYYL